MKKIVMFIIAAVMSFSCITALAAPQYIEPTAVSNSTSLIVITNPPSISSTTQKGVVFCGYGEAGTKVSLYIYDSSIAKYRPIYQGAYPVSLDIVYQSGLFWKKVDFSGGNHKVIVYAEKGGRYQIVKREINVLDPAISSKLKDYALNFRASYK